MSGAPHDAYSRHDPNSTLVETSVGKIRIFRAPPGGRVGEGQAGAFLAAVAAHDLALGSSVALDVSSVEFFGTDDIDALVALHDRLAGEGGHFVVFGANGVVRDVLHLAGLDALVGVFAVERAALDYLRDAASRPWH